MPFGHAKAGKSFCDAHLAHPPVSGYSRGVVVSVDGVVVRSRPAESSPGHHQSGAAKVCPQSIDS